MTKTRIILVGGFLGAGKTTLLLKAAEHLVQQGFRVGLVTNDQGQDLVDTALAHQHVMPVEEVAGGCFCCRFPDLINAVRQLQTEAQPDVILAEPVGSCTDLMATVVRPFQKYHTDEFEIAPLTILLDPNRDLGHFPSTVTYLYRQQLSEAEVIALNKCDLLEAPATQEKVDVLKMAYPAANVVSLSARSGSGIAEWVDQMMTKTSEANQVLDIDYDIYAEAEATLGWLNAKITLNSDVPVLPASWITQTMEALRETFIEKEMGVAHLKLHLNTPDAPFKASITQTDETMTWDSQRDDLATHKAEVILNARVNTEPEQLQTAVKQVISDICQRQKIQPQYTHFECFSPLPPQPTFRLL